MNAVDATSFLRWFPCLLHVPGTDLGAAWAMLAIG